MAKYDVKYKCGHQGEVVLFGNHRDREWRLGQEGAKLCPECYKADLANQNAKAAEQNQADGLPALEGTPNQIAWAEQIRRDALVKMESMYNELDDDETKNALGTVMAVGRASWWIDNRLVFVHPVYPLSLSRFLCEQARVLEHKTKIEVALPGTLAAKFEATIRPESAKTETVVEVLPTAGRVTIVFPERRDDFRNLVKSMGYRWDETSWVRTISKQNGSPNDRAAEAGHRLLAAGFSVCLYDEATRSMATTGTYQQEQTRWVFKGTTGKYTGWFIIQWSRQDDFYDVARRLPGSRWESPSVVVPPEQYEQVLDFAQMYGFSLSEAALATVEAVRTAKQAMLVADVAPVPKRKRKATTQPPDLDMPKEVAISAELRDKD